MKINLEIINRAYLLAQDTVETPNLKTIVPNMLMRRRLTKAAKIMMELIVQVNFLQGRILCGSGYGELETTANILHAIKNSKPVSPTDFQNSVYNTAVSYVSILMQNQHEILTISSGDKTSLNVLKAGALKALDGDEILLLCFETLNIPQIEEVNQCIDFLESGVALVVKITDNPASITLKKSNIKGVPPSIQEMLYLAQFPQDILPLIVEIEI